MSDADTTTDLQTPPLPANVKNLLGKKFGYLELRSGRVCRA
jgi:hypothetical protein